MAVPRAKKNKKSEKLYKLEEVTSMFELYKSAMYAFLADKKKFAQDEIQELDLFYMRSALGLRNGDYNKHTFEEKAKEYGTNLREVFNHTNKVFKEMGGF